MAMGGSEDVETQIVSLLFFGFFFIKKFAHQKKEC